MSRQWVYPRAVTGRYQGIHRWTGIALQLILFVTPWITVRGHPALWLDVPGRRVYALGAVFRPGDTVLLVLIGLILALGLFFFTALYGRLWCGYACPQTVFLEEWIRPLEHLLEGDRGVRMARDRGPRTWDRAWRKGSKWLAFAVLSAFVALTLVSYFTTPMRLWTGQVGPVAGAAVVTLAVAMFLDFAWFREQLCNYVCPYARFQGALTDDESQVLAYDTERGRIDCVDCRKCVVACPQGIDIREGFQLECINCARCADACEPIMVKRGRPNLIGYTTVAEREGRRARSFRGRTGVYGALLVGLGVALVTMLVERGELAASLVRAPGVAWTHDADGYVRNTYLLRATNNDAVETRRGLEVTADLGPGVEVFAPPFDLAAAETRMVPVAVRLPEASVTARTMPLQLVVSSSEVRVELEAAFLTGLGES